MDEPGGDAVSSGKRETEDVEDEEGKEHDDVVALALDKGCSNRNEN